MKKASDFPLNRFSKNSSWYRRSLRMVAASSTSKAFRADRFDDEDINRVWYGISLISGRRSIKIIAVSCYAILSMSNRTRTRRTTIASCEGWQCLSFVARAHGQQWSASFPYGSRRCRGAVLRPPGGGGRTSKIASSVRVNNEIVKRRPDSRPCYMMLSTALGTAKKKTGHRIFTGFPSLVYGTANLRATIPAPMWRPRRNWTASRKCRTRSGRHSIFWQRSPRKSAWR